MAAIEPMNTPQQKEIKKHVPKKIKTLRWRHNVNAREKAGRVQSANSRSRNGSTRYDLRAQITCALAEVWRRWPGNPRKRWALTASPWLLRRFPSLPSRFWRHGPGEICSLWQHENGVQNTCTTLKTTCKICSKKRFICIKPGFDYSCA